MTQAIASDLLHRVWEFPLFAALHGRRSRRFGLGFAIDEGPHRHRSGNTPVPLDEVEEALLVAAATGVSGIPLWDGSRPPARRGGDGRTFGSTTHGRRRPEEGVACASREEIDRLYAEACREGRPTRAPIDAGDPVGYTARIADPDGHSLELSFGQEVGLTVQSAAKG